MTGDIELTYTFYLLDAVDVCSRAVRFACLAMNLWICGDQTVLGQSRVRLELRV
jgi:hypothetical protein